MRVLEIEFSNGCYVKDIIYDLATHGDECGLLFNLNEEQRINMVTRVAAISRGKDKANNPTTRYGKLLNEAAPNIPIDTLNIMDGDGIGKAPGRPLEFAPVKLRHEAITDIIDYKTNNVKIDYMLLLKDSFGVRVEKDIFFNDILPFSYLKDGWLYTNVRALVNAGIDYDLIPYEPTEGFNIIEVKAPYFVFAQIRTHGRLSQVAVSERVVTEDEYWLPEDVLIKVKTTLTKNLIEEMNLNCTSCDRCMFGKRIHGSTTIKELIGIFLELPIDKVQNILKIAGYDKELYNRWPNHLKFKRWVMGGYIQDPKQWPHFLLEREAYEDKYKSWVQETTKETALAIKKILL